MQNPKLDRNVTYYLGAGASANAIPVVSDLKAGVEKMANLFVNNYPKDPLANKIKDELSWLGQLHAKYYSIDTAAKIFFHRDNSEGSLRRLKQAVSLYFLLEQIECPELNRQQTLKEPIDNRYYRLLAYYLGSSPHRALPENLNFISWNYDFQLELAYHHFTDHTYVKETSVELKSLPRAGIYKSLKRKYAEGGVIHLNGIAGLYIRDEERHEKLRHLVDNIDKSTVRTVFQSLKELDILGSYSSDFTLSFAWEHDVHGKEFLDRAKEIMSQTSDLVVVGYSFPNFNRNIDKELLNAFISAPRYGRNFYIQDPNAKSLEVVDNLFQLTNSGITTVSETSCQEFFIPPEV